MLLPGLAGLAARKGRCSAPGMRCPLAYGVGNTACVACRCASGTDTCCGGTDNEQRPSVDYALLRRCYGSTARATGAISAYALAMRCPGLMQRIMIRVYAILGTDFSLGCAMPVLIWCYTRCMLRPVLTYAVVVPGELRP
eukprot:3613360-Rhodomonas_salina.4